MTRRTQKIDSLKGLRVQGRHLAPDLDTRPGRIVLPIAGETDWAPDGAARGVWGRDKPLRYVQIQGLGVRELNAIEHRVAVLIHGPIKGS